MNLITKIFLKFVYKILTLIIKTKTMTKQEFDKKVSKTVKELINIQNRIIAKKSLTKRQEKMASIGFSYVDKNTAAKQIIKRGI